MNPRKLLPLTALILAALMAVALIVYLNRPTTPAEAPPDFTAQQGDPFIICLDAGHGGTDVGAQDSTGSRNEKDDNLRLALAVRDALDIGGSPATVIMTREDDTALTLTERCEFANAQGATLFVSLHRNTGGGTGVEVWISSAMGTLEARLGGTLLAALEDTEISRSRGLRSGTASSPLSDYVVIRDTAMPACIVELGFLDSDTDNALFDEHLEAYAAAIAGALLSLTE